MPKTTQQILNEIKTSQATASIELELVKPNVRAGTEIAVRQATDRLVVLKEEYRARVLAQAAAFLVDGPTEKVGQFCAEAAKTAANAFVVDANAVYAFLAERVDETLDRSREWGIQQFTALIMAIRKVMFDLNIDFLDFPEATWPSRRLATRLDVQNTIKEMVLKSSGNTLSDAFTRAKLAEAALQAECAAPSIAAIVTNAASGALKAFTNRKLVNLNAGDEINESFVIGVFGSPTKDTSAPAKRQSTRNKQTNQSE